jgi:hypothetical protein
VTSEFLCFSCGCRLLRDFLECAPGMSIEDACDTLAATGAALLKMVHTHDGAAVVCALLGYGTAKDRKRIVKALKGEPRDHPCVTLALVCLCQAVMNQHLVVCDMLMYCVCGPPQAMWAPWPSTNGATQYCWRPCTHWTTRRC